MLATTENETIASSISWLALCRDGANLGWKCLPGKRDWRTAEVQIVAWFLQSNVCCDVGVQVAFADYVCA